jgi:hypothetical protein
MGWITLMRPILLSDLDLAARVLLGIPVDQRRVEMDAILKFARQADAFRQATGRILVGYGDGSILSVALGRPRSGSALADINYRACLGIVLERIAMDEETHNRL